MSLTNESLICRESEKTNLCEMGSNKLPVDHTEKED